MLFPIRCISCGRPVAHLWEQFRKRVSEGENPKAVLDSMGVKTYCCRSLFLTNVDTLPQIAKFK